MGNKEAICTRFLRKRILELGSLDENFLNDDYWGKHIIDCPPCAKEYFWRINQQALTRYLNLENQQLLQNQPA